MHTNKKVFITGCGDCGTTFAYSGSQMKDAAAWKHRHKCARLPETYRPKHMLTKETRHV